MLLIGAGGHAKTIVETLAVCGRPVTAYVDTEQADWLDARQIVSDDRARGEKPVAAVLGIGGISPQALEGRLDLMNAYIAAGFRFPATVHPRAIVSEGAELGDGVIVLPGAVINAGARVSVGALINTGAIVEHDCRIGEGAHIAPGAIVLGGASVGRAALVGAGAVVLPGAVVEALQLVPAMTRCAS